MQKTAYQVLFYYKYVPMENPETLAVEHLEACNEIGLKGRIIVGTEGINGTCSGTVEQTEAYMNMMKSDERFKDIVYKIDEADGHTFKKMHVRAREETVNLSLLMTLTQMN